MRGALPFAGGLPRATTAAAEDRAARLVLDIDPSTPRWAREHLEEHLDEIRVGLARMLMKGFALWECAAVWSPALHPSAREADEGAGVLEREDLADLLEDDAGVSRAVLLAPEEKELRAVVLRAEGEPWVGPVWAFERNV